MLARLLFVVAAFFPRATFAQEPHAEMAAALEAQVDTDPTPPALPTRERADGRGAKDASRGEARAPAKAAAMAQVRAALKGAAVEAAAKAARRGARRTAPRPRSRRHVVLALGVCAHARGCSH